MSNIMLKTFKVTNFKNFHDECVLDFSAKKDYSSHPDLIKNGLLNKTLLYGKNGSGKSNLGFAIFDITNHLSDKAKAISHYNNYLNADSSDTKASFSYLFLDDKGRNIEYAYSKDEKMNLCEETLKVDGALLFHYDYSTNRALNNIEGTKTIVLGNSMPGASVLKFMRNNTPNLSADSPLYEITSFVDEMLWFRSVRTNEYMGMLNGVEFITDFIIQNNYVDDFQSFLKDCGLDYHLAVREVPGGKVLVIVFAHKELVFLQTISTGTESLLLFYYWHKRCCNSIQFLYLDEFDAFYHYSLSKKIMLMVNDNSSYQSVITTHNTYLMDNAFMRPDSYLIIENGKIKSLPFRTTKTIRDGNSLENMYLSGLFEE